MNGTSQKELINSLLDQSITDDLNSSFSCTLVSLSIVRNHLGGASEIDEAPEDIQAALDFYDDEEVDEVEL